MATKSSGVEQILPKTRPSSHLESAVIVLLKQVERKWYVLCVVERWSYEFNNVFFHGLQKLEEKKFSRYSFPTLKRMLEGMRTCELELIMRSEQWWDFCPHYERGKQARKFKPEADDDNDDDWKFKGSKLIPPQWLKEVAEMNGNIAARRYIQYNIQELALQTWLARARGTGREPKLKVKLPQGARESATESPQEAAVRELKEETGIDKEHLGKIHPMRKKNCFAAILKESSKECKKERWVMDSDSEVIAVEWVQIDDSNSKFEMFSRKRKDMCRAAIRIVTSDTESVADDMSRLLISKPARADAASSGISRRNHGPRKSVGRRKPSGELDAVDESASRGDTRTGSSSGMTLLVRNLSKRSTEDDIRRMFGKRFDESIQDIHIPRRYGRSRGFAFLTFDDRKLAEEALETMNGVELDGRKIEVLKANRQKKRGN